MSDLPVNQPRTRPLDQSVVVGGRAALISQSLKAVARRARSPRNIWISSGGIAQRRWQDVFTWAVFASFGLLVLLPNLIAATYLTFIASNQYSSEMRFAVRGSQTSTLSSLTGIIGLPSAQQVQDSLILLDYIESRSIVEALNRSLNLRQMFSRDRIDYFSQFDPSDSNEELMYYWRRHVDTRIDSMSGIITVVIRAFTPQDSFAVANDVISLSEALVNDLTERARRDALRKAQFELTRANQNLQEKNRAMREIRNTEGILDTGKTSEVMTQLLGELRLDLIRLEQEYSAQRRTILPSSPQLRVLEARINSMKDQIGQLQGEMTDSKGTGSSTLSKVMSRFDRETLDKDIAEKQYIAAAAEYERSRIDLESQHVYLATFLKPVLAQEALYPRRLWLWAIVTVLSLLLWGSAVGTAVLVRNHVAA